jgi:hypothetical protein
MTFLDILDFLRGTKTRTLIGSNRPCHVPSHADHYPATEDWVGLGHVHEMWAWDDPEGVPRSVVLVRGCWV